MTKNIITEQEARDLFKMYVFLHLVICHAHDEVSQDFIKAARHSYPSLTCMSTRSMRCTNAHLLQLTASAWSLRVLSMEVDRPARRSRSVWMRYRLYPVLLCSRLFRDRRRYRQWVTDAFESLRMGVDFFLVLVSGWSDNGWLSGGMDLLHVMDRMQN